MSGVFCAWDPDATRSAAELRAAFDEMDYRGADGEATVAVDDVRLGHQHLHATPEAVGEAQPVREGDAWLAVDGRVDNRPALGRDLYGEPPGPDRSDVEVLFDAYRAHGERFVESVVGAYAFVLYDAADRRLLFGRDGVGHREVFYARAGGTLLVASDRAPILACADGPVGVQERRLAEYVEDHTLTPGLTVYEGLYAVPPGHYAVVEMEATRSGGGAGAVVEDGTGAADADGTDAAAGVADGTGADVGGTGATAAPGARTARRTTAGPAAHDGDGGRPLAADPGVTLRRHWRPTETPVSGSASELADRLESLCRTAVAARLRSPEPVGVELSGGMDSTTVAALASARADRPVPAYSMVFEDVGDPELIDRERERARAVARMHDLDLTEIVADGLGPRLDAPCYEPIALETPAVNKLSVAFRTAYERAAGDGNGVLLTGEGGNTFDGKQSAYVDLLRRGKVRASVGSMLRDETGNWRLLWFVLVKLFGLLGGRYPESREFGPDALLADAFQERVEATEFGWPAYPEGYYDQLVNQDTHSAKFHSLFLPLLHFDRRLALACGVDVRHPLLDARVLDFAYSMPKEYTMRNGRRKYLFRRFASAHLPERVHAAGSGPTFEPVVTRGLAEERDRVEDLLSGSELAARGYVPGDRLASVVETYYRRPPGEDDYAGTAPVSNNRLWLLATAERWLRAATDAGVVE